MPMRLIALLTKFRREKAGAAATEYALLIALVAFLSVTAWDGIGGSLKKIFEHITGYL